VDRFKARIMDEAAVLRALRRISYEIIERNRGTKDVVLVGIRRRGVPLAEHIADYIACSEGLRLPVGRLDISFEKEEEDVSRHADNPVLHAADIPFSVTGKHVVLVDDVLYTGRTVRTAIDTLFTLGHPASVQLAILCDRGHRELPIRADYIGKNLPTSKTERVAVRIPPYDNSICMELFETVH